MSGKIPDEPPVIVPRDMSYKDQLTELIVSRQSWIIATLREHGVKVNGLTVTWSEDGSFEMKYQTESAPDPVTQGKAH